MHKLQVNIINDMKNPLHRYYTLTHSDITGMRYLFIDNRFTEEEYDDLMDHVIAKWHLFASRCSLKVYCFLECPASKYSMYERYQIFKRHMPSAINAILIGDKSYICSKNYLLESKIDVYYIKENTIYLIENYGLVSDRIIK